MGSLSQVGGTIMLVFGETYFGELAGVVSAVIPVVPELPQYVTLTVTGLRTGGDGSASPAILRGGATVVSYADGSPKVFIEGIGDFVQFTLVDDDADPIDEDAFTAMRATLRDPVAVINAREDQDVLNLNGGAWISPGTFRMSLSPSDQVAVGPHEYQTRELTLTGVHSDGQPWHWTFFYTLRNILGIR